MTAPLRRHLRVYEGEPSPLKGYTGRKSRGRRHILDTAAELVKFLSGGGDADSKALLQGVARRLGVEMDVPDKYVRYRPLGRPAERAERAAPPKQQQKHPHSTVHTTAHSPVHSAVHSRVHSTVHSAVHSRAHSRKKVLGEKIFSAKNIFLGEDKFFAEIFFHIFLGKFFFGKNFFGNFFQIFFIFLSRKYFWATTGDNGRQRETTGDRPTGDRPNWSQNQRETGKNYNEYRLQ